MIELPDAVRASYPDDDPRPALAVADEAEAAGDLPLAASALDRAHGVAPLDTAIAERRRRLLDALAVEEHGLRFRYIPTGTFLMGSEDGDPDERPVRPTRVEYFWMSDTTISWGAFCRLLSWPAPGTRTEPTPLQRFHLDLLGNASTWTLGMALPVRLQYCEDATTEATDWHRHDPTVLAARFERFDGGPDRTGLDVYGAPPRPMDTPWRYESKPMVAVSWQEAELLAATISSPTVLYGLPSEVQWEKAARGALIGCRYAWGNEAPTPERCDFGRFEPFALRPSRSLPPNDYGLYGMCGSVWEWTSDYYDATPNVPRGRAVPTERVLRGGSWTDPAEAVTVSFRMSRHGELASRSRMPDHLAPNIGFRLVRFDRWRGAI
jgi:formylglycine-generating enzyme required for sulfatase activity